jgi:hypothetical protein
MASLPFDWYARRFVEVNLDFHYLNAFPIPNVPRDQTVRLAVEGCVSRLAAVDGRYADWAAAVGVPVGTVKDADEKENLIAKLDACVARLYGLDERQLRHVFETFHPTWDYGARLERVLHHFEALAALEATT